MLSRIPENTHEMNLRHL